MNKLELNKIHKGLAFPTIKTFPDKSINCVVTSPPYWQLRDYGFSEQWGLEPTFEEYLEHLWSLMDEIWRVLKDDGTVWVNLGDTYGTVSGRMGTKIQQPKHSNEENQSANFKQPKSINKCLLLIPHRFAIGCIERGWIMRNDIVWAKRNCMPESVTDRFSKKHEYFFLMAKNKKYYFDLDGIREDHAEATKIRSKYGHYEEHDRIDRNYTKGPQKLKNFQHNKGKNPGSVSDFWDIPTKPSSKEHYAAYNDELIKKPILAGCPEDGVILDPFAGTGTTLITGYIHGRNVVGIEGNPKDAEAAQSDLDTIIQRKKDIKEFGFAKSELNKDYPTFDFK